jgi:Cu(I)/Ag(I) efflux system membrane protein CusA/SilA
VTESGADVMKRIAAPMIGGAITTGIIGLLLYPVIFVFWRKRHLKKRNDPPRNTETATSSST